MCNDNAYGLMGTTMAARLQGVTPPCVMQNDYSMLNRRVEENGLSEASAPWNEDVGFMAYNMLAGGVLTGKYLEVPAAPDDEDRARAQQSARQPRGRMDELSWGRTLYRYRSGPAQEATRAYARLAKEAGMPLTEMALRWCRSRNACTSVLLGTSSVEQLKQDVKYFTGERGEGVGLGWDRVKT
jgi:aryl-alcohol dehydrogenase-like predicted oxidoreductase